MPYAGWGPARVFGGLGFLVVTAIFAALIVAAFDRNLDSLAATTALQSLLATSLIGTAFWFASPDLRSLVSTEALGMRAPLRKAVKPAVIAYFGYVACAVVIALLLAPEQKDVTRELGGGSGAVGTIISGFLIIAVAPLSEEIFFRGFVFSGLRRGMPVVAAAVASSAIWGVFHYTGAGTFGVVVQITVFGFWLSWLYERTGSIWPTMAVHAVNNTIAFLILTL